VSNKKTSRKRQNQSKNLMMGVILVAVMGVIGIFVVSQTTNNGVPKLSPIQYTQQYANTKSAHLLIDVRTPEEFASGHIAGAINISLQSLPDRLNEVPHDKPVVVYCHSGNRSAQAASLLKKAGYTNIYDLGGILAWTAAGLPTIQ
jgi:rhodanese-related sulfurtransferase